ncbi:TadE family type IV pilus minor pilin [Cellulomonas persica]|uniref:TadE-like domain-containing protein n=1 Tax=Cellulomonas persica TaxID=76861 RepID=A0A510URZ9_9CELL|nr:TadE family type IV pilus minor pilin [Cellulomonas persica]GEK17434.1 hypothetical protein CPE01_11670 [Cellulomonas persica]
MRRGQADRGSVTAELAVGLPAVVLLLLVVLGAGAAGVVQQRCAEAARTGARLAALGEDDGAVVDASRRVAGDAASVTVTHDEGWVTVVVAGSLPVAGIGQAVTVSGRATAWVEP